jgi:hypothetical protein
MSSAIYRREPVTAEVRLGADSGGVSVGPTRAGHEVWFTQGSLDKLLGLLLDIVRKIVNGFT